MAVVSVAEVQAWVEPSKLTISAVDPEFHDTAKAAVFSALSQSYDTTVWIDAPSTPELVRKIVAMLIAAWTYAKAYSEDDATEAASGIVLWLEAKANALLSGLSSGMLDLIDVVGITIDTTPVFWPDDTTEVLNPNDAASFTVGQVF